jgi:hypothetical protein
MACDLQYRLSMQVDTEVQVNGWRIADNSPILYCNCECAQ